MGTEPTRIYRSDEQEMVIFHGRPIVAVRLDDGRVVVTLRSLCEGMGLNTQAQIRRAERTEALAGEIARPWLETDAGPQEQPALVLDVLPGWLMGVDTTRIKGEAHDTILAYQREAYGVLYRYFAERTLALPVAPQTALTPTTPTTPTDPQIAQIANEMAEIRHQIETLNGVANLLYEHQEHLASLLALLALPGQLAELGGELTDPLWQALGVLEELAKGQNDIGERQEAFQGFQESAEARIAHIDQRTQRLTSDHARAVQEQVDDIVRATKKLAQPLTHMQLYGRLKHRFRASSYREIADEQYAAVKQFLQDLLRDAKAGEGPAQGSLF